MALHWTEEEQAQLVGPGAAEALAQARAACGPPWPDPLGDPVTVHAPPPSLRCPRAAMSSAAEPQAKQRKTEKNLLRWAEAEQAEKEWEEAEQAEKEAEKEAEKKYWENLLSRAAAREHEWDFGIPDPPEPPTGARAGFGHVGLRLHRAHARALRK